MRILREILSAAADMPCIIAASLSVGVGYMVPDGTEGPYGPNLRVATDAEWADIVKRRARVLRGKMGW